MAIDTGIGISLDLVSTTQQAPLGQTVLKPAGTDGAGEQVWIYVQATALLAVGDVCRRVYGAGSLAERKQAKVVQTAASAAPHQEVAGVAQHAIAANSYGWILRSGVGSVKVAAAATVENSLFLNGTGVGEADNGAGAVAGFGTALEASAGAAVITAVLNCQG